MTALAYGASSAGTQIRWQGDGATDDAVTISDRLASAVAHLLEPISTGESINEGGRALAELEAEACVADWDSKGGEALHPWSVAASRRFLALMPVTFPAPHIAADPDGEVSFEWKADRGWMFSLSFGADQSITYAGLFGPGRVRGVEYFADEIPPPILEGLRRTITGR